MPVSPSPSTWCLCPLPPFLDDIRLEDRGGEKGAEENGRRVKSWPSDWFRIVSRDTLVHITAVLFPSFSLSSASLPSPHRLLDFSAKTERRTAAAAAVETSTLLGCRSCGTGLRELPLEELHSPRVLPRLHGTHIYICLSMPLLHGRDHCVYVSTHAYLDARTYLQVCDYTRPRA